MQFTLGMPFLGVLGKFYRNRKGLIQKHHLGDKNNKENKHKHTLPVKMSNIHFFNDLSIFYIFIVILWNIITI